MFCALILPFLLIPTASQADLAQLAREFVRQNSDLQAVRTRLENSGREVDLLKGKKTWSLQYRPSFVRSNLQSLSPTALDWSKSGDHTFSLVKDFEWGGKLTLAKTLSHRRQGLGGGVSAGYTFTHEIAYTQNLGADFFGRIFLNASKWRKDAAKWSPLATKRPDRRGC